MSTTGDLTPAQWRLMLRVLAREAPMTDMYAWVSVSNAEWVDVLDLDRRGLLSVSTGQGTLPDKLPGGHEGLAVGLSPRGRYLASTIMLPLTQVLRLARMQQRGVSVETAAKNAESGALLCGDEMGLFEVRNEVDAVVDLDWALLAERRHRRESLRIYATPRGSRYAAYA